MSKIKRSIRISKYIIYKETFVNYKEYFLSFLGSFIGIGIIALLQSLFLNEFENIFLIGSFGASSVLIYGAVQSPLAQPRNVIGGHVLSAIIGVSSFKFLPEIIWISAPLAVSMSIITMQFTKTLHPPGGATALIAVTGSAKIKTLGFLYVIFPVLTGSLILLCVAFIFNNCSSYREYPRNNKVVKKIKSKLNITTKPPN